MRQYKLTYQKESLHCSLDFFADNLTLAIDHAVKLCLDRNWKLIRVERYAI